MIVCSLILSACFAKFDDEKLPKTVAEVAHRLPDDEPDYTWLTKTLQKHPEFLDAEDNGRKLTWIAISNDKREYLDVFINAGATIDPPMAAFTGDVEWLKKHFASGGDIHDRFEIEDGFVFGASSLLEIAARGGDAATIAFLLENGGKKFADQLKNGRLLRAAVQSRSEEAVDLLIASSAQDAMYAALWLAQDGKDVAMLTHLIAKKPELPNVVFPELPWNRMGAGPSWDAGTTLLMHAAQYQELNVVDLLLSKGAKANAKDSRGRNALDYMNSSWSPDAIRIVKRLRAAGAEMSVGATLRFGTVAEIEKEIQRGRLALNALIEVHGNGERLPLEIALGRPEVVSLLLKRGADPWKSHGNVVSVAERIGYGSLGSGSVQAIIDGLDAKGLERFRAWRRPQTGWTALHPAAMDGDVLIIRILLKAGMDVTAKDKEGKSAADLACNDVIRKMVAPKAPPK
jgi:uncharacterized protein